jgi:hypothetical protein
MKFLTKITIDVYSQEAPFFFRAIDGKASLLDYLSHTHIRFIVNDREYTNGVVPDESLKISDIQYFAVLPILDEKNKP